MNKTVSINLAGLVFNIEEPAYVRLKKYLDDIRRMFSHESGALEIMEDIESRIAELFHERLGQFRQLVTDVDVEEVILLMGEPRDYAVEEDSKDNEECESQDLSSQKVEDGFRQKRLYRDEDNASVAGVCAGLGHYFNVDPVVFRLLFVLMVILGGSGILIYLILVLVVPSAKTTAEKLQMRGEPVNIESIKEHVNNLTEDAKKGMNVVSKNFLNAIDKSHGALQKVFLVVSKIIGVGLLVGGLIGTIVLVGIFFGNFELFPFCAEGTSNNLDALLALVVATNNFSVTFLALFGVVIIPWISIFVIGMLLLTEWRYKMKVLLIGMLVCWIIGVIVLSFYGIETGLQFKEEREVSEIVDYDVTAVGDTLYIDIAKLDPASSYLEEFEQDDLLFIDKDSVCLSAVSVSIIKEGSLSEFEIAVQKISNGPSGKKATEHAQSIRYNCKVVGNELLLANYYSFPVSDKIRGQRVVLEVRVPEDKYIVMKNYDDHFHGEVRTKSMRRVEDESKWSVWTTKQDEVAESVTEKD